MKAWWLRSARISCISLLALACGGGGSGAAGGQEKLARTQQAAVLLSASFDSSSSGFTYIDDPFDTSLPNGASGVQSSGRLQLTLGQPPHGTGAYSGGWRNTFTATGPVTGSFFYRLTTSDAFESSECTEVRLAIDATTYGSGDNPWVARICDGGTTQGTFSFTSSSLPSGSHTITLGGHLNGNSEDIETSTIDFDDVVVNGELPVGCGDLQCNGSETCATCPGDCGACTTEVAFIENGGQVVMEAENFNANTAQGGSSWVADTAGSPSGGSARRADPNSNLTRDIGYTTTSPRLDYRVHFTQPGTYNVWLRGRALGTPAVGNNDSVHAGIDGAATATADRMHGFTTGYTWRHSTSDGPNATVVVSAPGVRTFNLWMREDGFVVDKILLTTNASLPTPSGNGPAESARLNSCGDSACNGAETCASCAPDCGACAACPNGTCEAGETCSSCPQDCGQCVWGLDSRPANPTCLAPPPLATGFALHRRWPSLTFAQPLGLVQAPADDSKFYVLEKTGRMRVVARDDNAATAPNFLDLSSIVNADSEGGLLSAAFHPSYATNRFVVVSYTLNVGGVFTMRVSRFQSTDGGLTLNPSTETVLLAHPKTKTNHNAGHVAFGPDGYLYVSFGDDAWQDPPRMLQAADPNNWYGKVLRIDVNAGSPYSIPADNPFAAGGGRPEVYAYGLRNPWRFSFDRQNGELWLADVGEDAWEEIDKIVVGGFYGWPHREADACRPTMSCSLAYRSPEYAYRHGGPLSITGGYVYRGAAIPELSGHYVYGDFITGDVWAYDAASHSNRSVRTGGGTLAAFGEDNLGELYAIRHGSGTIERLEKVTGGGPSEFPALITDTGCFSVANPTVPVSGAIPYTIALPFWADGADKQRYLAIPDGTSIAVDPKGDWVLPPGGVTIKHFRWQGQLFETRFFVRHADGTYSGYTYEWNAEQTQATLVATGGKTRNLPGLSWTYPSRSGCFACHTDVAGGSLGLETRQLNVNGFYPSTGRTANQLTTLDHVAMFGGNLVSLPPFPAVSDASVSLLERSKAYLHVNCSNCHRPAGPGRGNFDARFETLFGDMRLCGEPPALGDLGVSGALLLKPGRHAESVSFIRMSQRASSFMPPLASSVADSAGAALLTQWIDGLAACPPPTVLVCDVASNRVANCDFGGGTSSWQLRLGPGGAGSHSVTGNALRIDATSPGTLDWHVQDVQVLGALAAGNYQISFDARAALPRTIVVNLGEEGDDYTSFCQQQVSLTATMSSFSITCNGMPSDDNVKLDFNVGLSSTASVFVDNVYFGPPR